MSLSARDRQALSSIEDEFSESDSRLSRLFDEFSQRMAGKKMSTPELGQAGWRRIASAPSRWLLRRLPRRARPSWLPTVLAVSFLLISTVTVALVVSHLGINGRCPAATSTQAQCGVRAPLPH